MNKRELERANELRIKRAFDRPIRVSKARKKRNQDASYVIEVRSSAGKPTTYERKVTR